MATETINRADTDTTPDEETTAQQTPMEDPDKDDASTSTDGGEQLAGSPDADDDDKKETDETDADATAATGTSTGSGRSDLRGTGSGVVSGDPRGD